MIDPAHPGRMLFVNIPVADLEAAQQDPEAFAASMQDANAPA